MEYLEVTVRTASAGIESVASYLTAGGFDSLVVEDQEEYETFLEGNRDYWDYIDESLQEKLAGLSQIRLYIECDGTQEQQLKKLRRILDAAKTNMPERKRGSLDITVEKLAPTNWEESWKDNYPPQPVGKNLIVVPCWNPDDTQGRIPIILDPGLTFGTGAHPSTQMVMEFMEEHLRPGSCVIDLGSGSGILSITALRLGAKRAVGVDIDPKAEDIARENAGYNRFGPEVFTACTGNVSEDREMMESLAQEGYEIVLVNIVADVIISLAPVLTRFLKPGGRVILSGILDVREAEVIAALENHGLRVLERKAKEDWRSLLCGRAVEP